MASRISDLNQPRSSQHRTALVRIADQPESTGLELVIHEEASDTGSSRMPSRLARRARPVRQYRTAPTLPRLLPTLPTVPWIRLPPALPRHYDGPGIEGLTPPTGKSAPRGALKDEKKVLTDPGVTGVSSAD